MARRKVSKALTPAKKTNNTAKYDWDQLRTTFVEGVTTQDGSIRYLNLRELSDRFGVPYQRVREKSSEERWMDKRQQYQMEVSVIRQREHMKKMAGEAVAFDNNALNAAKIGTTMVTARLGQIAQEFNSKAPMIRAAQERMARGEAVDKWETQSPIYHRELEGLASALERFQNIGMRAMGTDVQRHEINNEGGGNLTINVVGELHRDDPERTAQILRAMVESGQMPDTFLEEFLGDGWDEEDEDSDIEEAVIVHDNEDEEQDDDDEEDRNAEEHDGDAGEQDGEDERATQPSAVQPVAHAGSGRDRQAHGASGEYGHPGHPPQQPRTGFQRRTQPRS